MAKLLLITLAILIVLSLICNLAWADWFDDYKQQVIELKHPYEKIDEVFPFIRILDEIITLTAGIRWVRVKDTRTGHEYQMIKGGWPDQWYFEREFYNTKETRHPLWYWKKITNFIRDSYRWYLRGEFPDWLEIDPHEIEWREKELKELKEKRYICD